MHKGSKSRQKS